MHCGSGCVSVDADAGRHFGLDEEPHDLVTLGVDQAELDREWDVDRLMESNICLLLFLGVSLGLSVSRKWLLLPALALPFLFQHSVQGWSPVLPLIRRLGVRTRGEIDKEKYALKAWALRFRGSQSGRRGRVDFRLMPQYFTLLFCLTN